MAKKFNIKEVMDKVSEIRDGFALEVDFQFVFGLAIRDLYGDEATIIMGYKYPDDALLEEDTIRQYIDVLVIMNKKWYPVELKFKHSKCKVSLFSDFKIMYELSNQSCRTNHRQAYVKDINRILKFRDVAKKNDEIEFGEGYAILLTNYEKFRTDEYSTYTLNKKGIKELETCEEKYEFSKDYDMKWFDYKTTNDKEIKNNFIYLITSIKK